MARSEKSTENISNEFGLQINLTRYEGQVLRVYESFARSRYVLSSSISEITIVARVLGKGEFKAKLYKHLSPVTLSRIQRAFPITGRANFFERNFFYIVTPVVSGQEKSKTDFKRGQVAFMPAGSAICFFLIDTRSYKPMNLLGQIEGDLEFLEEIKRGDSLEVEGITSGGT